MRDLQKKQETKRLIYSIPSLVVLCIITLLLLRGVVRVVDKERESSGKLSVLENKLAGLVIREKDLKDDVARLNTREGIEGEIRERFSVTEPGEHVAVIVDAKKTATTTEVVEKSWYKRLWAVIMVRLSPP